ncbi:hydrolase [Colwellia sp. 75C3]|uniref:phytase n=1 Tax=Colwellia sp. 75C3 TaxID=888425 RepID=UPI000C32A974|nr:phytase [Colwellia sp. 75C3]PKG81458.1 hydrolase [Colwellia sp. 75C3]
MTATTMRKRNLIQIALTLALTSTCSIAYSVEDNTASKVNKIETVTASVETRPHYKDAKGNFTDVDDPAIWVNPTDKSKSLVVTTLKKGGIDVYNLQGELLQFIPSALAPSCSDSTVKCDNKAGRTNNADIIYNFDFNGNKEDVVVVSDRGLDKMTIYVINPNAVSLLQNVTSAAAPLIFAKNQQDINEGRTAYGLATVKTDKAMAFVSQNSETRVAQLEIFDNGDGTISYKNIANIDFPKQFTLPDKISWTPCSDDNNERPHLEGIVADAKNDSLFLAQEDVGIWKVKLSEPNNIKHWQLIAKVKEYGIPYTRTWDKTEQEYICQLNNEQDKSFGSKHLTADAEGLTLYDGGNGQGYLLASSQGNNTIALFNREAPHQYINSFTVNGGNIDGVKETDGMMVVNADLGKGFSQGVLVMQDGDNKTVKNSSSTSGKKRESTNFKYVSWGEVAKKLDLPINTEFNRNK